MVLTKYKAAAVNAEPSWFNLEEGVQKTIDFINEAGQKGCKLIGFPEVWIPGYPGWVWIYTYGQNLPMVKAYRENSLAVNSEEMRRIRRAARDNQIFVSLGFSEIDQSTLYMSQLLIGPNGDVLNHRRKIKPTHMEKTIFGDGTGDTFMSVTETELGRLGQLCCWEHINPFLKALSVSLGEEVHVAAWPALETSSPMMPIAGGEHVADVATVQYAIESAAWVIAPFQRMTQAGLVKNTPPGVEPDAGPSRYIGHARIYKPNGVLAVPKPSEDFDGLLIADIDLSENHLMKSHADFAGHYMRPDLIRLLVDTSRKELVTELDAQGRIKSYSTAQRLGLDRPLDGPSREGRDDVHVLQQKTQKNSN